MSGTTPVLLVANVFPPVRGGSASVYAALARCAAGRIAVLAPQTNYLDGLPIIGWREHDRQAPYPILRIPMLRTTIGHRTGLAKLAFLAWDAALRLRVAAAVLRLIAAHGIRTVCIGDLLSSSWLIELLRCIPRLRIIAYIHGEEITTRRDDRASRQALRHSDAIIVVSRFTRAVVEELLGGQAAGRVRLIENGVDNSRFTPGEKSAALLERYGLTGAFVFVSVCRLVEKKGIDHTIRAFAAVARSHPGSRYLVVGTGPHAEALKALALAEGIADRVVFAGQVAEDELVEHYRLGDVFIMPNRRMPDGDTEGFGLVFLEANGCGLPVIAGQDGGSTDAVRQGVNGLVVDGHSVPAIAAAMRRLHDDPALRAAIRRQALEAAQRAGWEEKTHDFLQVCRG